MREILFRGKRADTGEWIIGDLYHVLKSKKDYLIAPIDEMGVDVVASTVGQYTGLTDKNGVKIFEGDILRAADYPKDTLTFSINWYDYGGFNTLGVNPSAFEAIGNIHDNPELLEGKQ